MGNKNKKTFLSAKKAASFSGSNMIQKMVKTLKGTQNESLQQNIEIFFSNM